MFLSKLVFVFNLFLQQKAGIQNPLQQRTIGAITILNSMTEVFLILQVNPLWFGHWGLLDWILSISSVAFSFLSVASSKEALHISKPHN